MAEVKLPLSDSYRPAFRLARPEQTRWAILYLLMLDFRRTAKMSWIAMLAFGVSPSQSYSRCSCP